MSYTKPNQLKERLRGANVIIVKALDKNGTAQKANMAERIMYEMDAG